MSRFEDKRSEDIKVEEQYERYLDMLYDIKNNLEKKDPAKAKWINHSINRAESGRYTESAYELFKKERARNSGYKKYVENLKKMIEGRK